MFKKLNLILVFSLFLFVELSYSSNMYLDNELLTSASRGEYSNIQEILQKGANINAKDMFGNNALILAADGGYVDVILLLLKNKIDINIQNKYGYTALLSAVTNYHKDSAYVLYKAGADANIANKYNTSPNKFVKSLGYKDILEFAKDKSEKPNIFPENEKANNSSFSSYYNSNWREYYNELIEKKENEKAMQLLVAYAESNYPEAAYLLGEEYLKKKDEVNGMKWLDKAARHGSCVTKYKIAKLILEHTEGAQTEKPIKLLKESISEGCYLGKVVYGKLLYLGIGTDRNYVESYRLFSEAAKFKLPEAIFLTGLSEYLGRGVAINKNEGIKKIREALKLGYDEAKDTMLSIEAEEILTMFANTDPTKRKTIKTDLLTSGFIVDKSDKLCDEFNTVKSMKHIYNVEKIRLCYPEEGKATQQFILNKELDSIHKEYLKNKVPRVEIKIAKKVMPEKKEKFDPEIVNKRKFFDFVIGDDKLITPVVIGENEKNNDLEVNNDEYSITINIDNKGNIENVTNKSIAQNNEKDNVTDNVTNNKNINTNLSQNNEFKDNTTAESLKTVTSENINNETNVVSNENNKNDINNKNIKVQENIVIDNNTDNNQSIGTLNEVVLPNNNIYKEKDKGKQPVNFTSKNVGSLNPYESIELDKQLNDHYNEGIKTNEIYNEPKNVKKEHSLEDIATKYTIINNEKVKSLSPKDDEKSSSKLITINNNDGSNNDDDTNDKNSKYGVTSITIEEKGINKDRPTLVNK